MRGIEFATRKLNIVENSVSSGILTVIGTFVASLIMAFVANLLMKPVQKLIDKVWIIK